MVETKFFDLIRASIFDSQFNEMQWLVNYYGGYLNLKLLRGILIKNISSYSKWLDELAWLK